MKPRNLQFWKTVHCIMMSLFTEFSLYEYIYNANQEKYKMTIKYYRKGLSASILFYYSLLKKIIYTREKDKIH